MDEIEQELTGYGPLLVLGEVMGLAAVVLVGVWMGHFRGGFAWTETPGLMFNWHPLLMTLGLIYFYGNGMLVYRNFRGEAKKRLKLLHAGLLIGCLVLASVGLKAVFDSHNLAIPPVPNLYSLHSWIGITVVVLFACQWISGLVIYLYPGLASHLKVSFLPTHTFLGTMIFVLSIVTALLGISEKIFFALNKTKKYQNRDAEGVIANWLGLALVGFGLIVVYLVRNPRYERLTRPEEELILYENTN
uniref:Cytochrome b561 n=1 Tax=Caligus clemensi TaxID=344056 RepID=C1C289_CALCM|nr:Cytochrome b561 [Caligus clemensi]